MFKKLRAHWKRCKAERAAERRAITPSTTRQDEDNAERHNRITPRPRPAHRGRRE